MNTALMLLCVAGSMTAGQVATVHRAGNLRVDLHRDRWENVDFPRHTLLYNRINIGFNYLKPAERKDYGNPDVDKSRLATTYFHRDGPVGIVMEKYNWHFKGKSNTYQADARLPASLIGTAGLDPCGQIGQLVTLWSEPPIAVIGMDAGTMASYARPAQAMHFFEPVPAIVKLSLPDKGKERYFHYVQDAIDRSANVKIFEGEPRATLEKEAGAGFYQVIVVNTYKLPVVTVHKDLMTKEGMAMLMSKTRDDGILCYHTSSRYYDLAVLIASVAKELNYECRVGHDLNDDYQKGHFTSEWVMVARDKKHLVHLEAPPGYAQALKNKGRGNERFWHGPPRTFKKFVWTDKGENSFRGVYHSDPTIAGFADWVFDGTDFVTFYIGFDRYLQPPSRFLQNALQARSRASADVLNRDLPAPPKDKK